MNVRRTPLWPTFDADPCIRLVVLFCLAFNWGVASADDEGDVHGAAISKLLELPPMSHRAACLNHIVRFNSNNWRSMTSRPDAFDTVEEIMRDVERGSRPFREYEFDGCNIVFAQVMFLCTEFHTPDLPSFMIPRGTLVRDEAEHAELVRSCIARTEAMKIFPTPGTLDERGWRARQSPQ